MPRDLDRPLWRGQRPWFEIWFAVLLDEKLRRALWIRQTIFMPKEGDGRATTWAAWFDADATPRTRAGKRYAPIEHAKIGDTDELIRIDDSFMSLSGAAGAVDDLQWEARWWGGRPVGGDLPAWVPAPTHARALLHDADMEATVSVAGASTTIRGRALAMHLWGKRRVPTVHWIWAPWLGDGSLEITAVSLRDRVALGLSSLELEGPHPLRGIPATAAHPHQAITATVAGPRKLVHVQAWAEADEMVGYVYRDTDARDLMVAQSDIGSAHYETFARALPGAPWRLVEERRTTGGVALEIHQRLALPEVDYIGWDETSRTPSERPKAPRRPDEVEWPEVTAIVALGLTYADHIAETGQAIERGTPPIAFSKATHALSFGNGRTRVPMTDELLAALAAVEPGLDGAIRARMANVPAVMDYEGELALVALGDIDDEQLAAGVAQPLGLAACNDLTARICQAFGEGMAATYDYWACAKSFPGFLPIADRVWAPPGGLASMPDLMVVTRVNGEERQRGSTRDLIYDLAAIVRAARTQLGRPLARGDVVLTGTPSGVGMRMSWAARRVAGLIKDRFRKAELLVSSYAMSSALLRPGDLVEVDAAPAGRVRTRLVV